MAVTAALALAGARALGAANQAPWLRPCSTATLTGDYGVQIQGTRTPPGGPTESIIGVVMRTYDGAGNIAQIDNVKGSLTGIVPNRPGFGTYEVYPDCTGLARFFPAPTVQIEERFVIVDGGREVRSITATSTPFEVMVTGVQRRVHER